MGNSPIPWLPHWKNQRKKMMPVHDICSCQGEGMQSIRNERKPGEAVVKVMKTFSAKRSVWTLFQKQRRNFWRLVNWGMRRPELSFRRSWRSFQVHARKSRRGKATVINGLFRLMLRRTWKEKWAPCRDWICWHLDLGLSGLQNKIN